MALNENVTSSLVKEVIGFLNPKEALTAIALSDEKKKFKFKREIGSLWGCRASIVLERGKNVNSKLTNSIRTK